MIVPLTDADFDREVRGSAGAWAVLFSSPWCGACGKVAPRFEAVAARCPGGRFGKVDISAHPKVAAGLGVLGIPAIVFFRDGEERGRASGAVSEEEIERGMRGIL
ncbi:MAG: thioredoxin family protein [bacterium]|nr:thioredoxin family protein [bacterium]